MEQYQDPRALAQATAQLHQQQPGLLGGGGGGGALGDPLAIEARQVLPAAPWRIRITDDLKRRIVPEAPGGWVRLEEAAAALGRSKQTILHWVQSGKLRSAQVVAGKRRGLRIELSERGNGLFADA